MMQQVDTYVQWINAQLENRSKSRHVSDLQKDMRDGVVFLQLIEVICQEKQSIIDSSSMSISDAQSNINNVLEFLSNNNVRVHHIFPKEIMEGNLKATMRLILALAAHFKPESFKCHTLHGTPRKTPRKNLECQRTTSLVSLASNAAASLVEASKNASNSGMSLHYKHRNKSRHGSVQTSTPITQNAHTKTCSQTLPSKSTKSYRLDNGEIPNITHSPDLSRTQRAMSELQPKLKRNSRDIPQLPPTTNTKRTLTFWDDSAIEPNKNEEFLQQYDVMSQELATTKDVLKDLEHLLLNGCTPEEQLGIESLKDDSFQEQLIMKNILMEQKVEECDDLKSQLNELKEINIRSSGEKTALEMRVSQQEQLILSLKSKLLRYEISKKAPNEQELEALLIERDKELQMVHDGLTKRDEIIQKQKEEIDSLSNNVVSKKRQEANLHAKLETSESTVGSLRQQVNELTERMHNVSLNNMEKSHGTNTNIDAVTLKLNETKIFKEKQKISREHTNMRITLSNIKRHFKQDDPVQHAFQSMEQSMTSLVDAVSVMESSVQCAKERQSNIPRAYPMQIKSPPSSDSGYDHNLNISLDGGEHIKIVYFLGKSITPVLKTSDIGLGFFTLRDFKHLIKRPGNYRYFFKSVDKDFGYVREELFYDEEVVPGQDGKIVAWLEKLIDEV